MKKFSTLEMYISKNYIEIDQAFSKYCKYLKKIEKAPKLMRKIDYIHRFDFHDIQIVKIKVNKNGLIVFQIKPEICTGSPPAKVSSFMGKKKVIKIKNLIFLKGVINANVTLPLGVNLIREKIFIYISCLEVYYNVRNCLFRFRIIATSACKDYPEYFEITVNFEQLKIEK